ncbi:MAG TPA: Gfo/Idh/MocA family oxidoreductase [Candidatus Limnocylindrales bacterium]|nr:Gfo/Idh/MocA family oxidoreductase [Candidatus Limnocylindrales bacterium]
MIDVGLIGFGLGGRCFHAPLIRAVPGLRLAAILQRTGDSAALAYPDVRIVRTLDALLAIDTLRLVVVSTPNQSHFPLAKRCLEAGRDVVVDKPFTTTVAEALELLKLAQKLGRVLTVYHDRRFDGDFQALRSVVASGVLGRIVRFEDTYDRYRPSPKPGAWREQPGPGSGILFDLAPHLLDQAFVLLGTPLALTADVRTERTGLVTDDAFDILLHYPQGARALLRAAMLSAIPRPRLLVLAEKGSFFKREFDPLEPALRAGQVPAGNSWVLEKEENWGELTVQENGQLTTRRVPSTGDWREFYANVRDAIFGRAPLLVTHQQILDVMVALELALESSSKRCTLPWRTIAI